MFRLENIKRGNNLSFKSCTIIFEQVKPNFQIHLEKIKGDFNNHSYIILFNNNKSLWEQLTRLEYG